MTEPIKIPRSSETRNVINGVEYIVKSVFKEDARESAEQKILRLIKERVITEINKTEGAVSRSN